MLDTQLMNDGKRFFRFLEDPNTPYTTEPTKPHTSIHKKGGKLSLLKRRVTLNLKKNTFLINISFSCRRKSHTSPFHLIFPLHPLNHYHHTYSLYHFWYITDHLTLLWNNYHRPQNNSPSISLNFFLSIQPTSYSSTKTEQTQHSFHPYSSQ